MVGCNDYSGSKVPGPLVAGYQDAQTFDFYIHLCSSHRQLISRLYNVLRIVLSTLSVPYELLL